MAHISVDLPSISQIQKKKLIEHLQNILSEIAEIDKNEISVSLHELPRENMNSINKIESNTKEINKVQKNSNVVNENKKKSFFKEMFP